MKWNITVFMFIYLFLPPLQAQETSFNGFGSVGISCFTSDQADFVLNIQPIGPGRSKNCDSGLDSLFGIQLDIEVSTEFELGLQLTSDRHADGDYHPEATVAQLRWKPVNDLTLRLGRSHNPSLLFSESRNVGYVQPWARPPLEVYGLTPLFIFDGIEVLYQWPWGDWSSEIHGGITVSEFDNPRSNASGVDPVDSEMAFINLTLQQDQLTLKVGAMSGRASVSSPDIDYVLSLLPADQVKALAIDDSPFDFYNLALRYEGSHWLFQGEISYRTLEDTFFRDQHGAYLTAGYRNGLWMPYATLAKRQTSGPASTNPLAQTLRNGTRFDTKSLALGLTWNFNQHAIAKLQADWIQPEDNSWGLFFNHAPSYNLSSPDSERLLTFNVDFIF